MKQHLINSLVALGGDNVASVCDLDEFVAVECFSYSELEKNGFFRFLQESANSFEMGFTSKFYFNDFVVRVSQYFED